MSLHGGVALASDRMSDDPPVADDGPEGGPAVSAPAERSPTLPTISPDYLRAINAFYRRRRAATFAFAGRSATVTAAWPPATGNLGARCRLDVSIDDAPGQVLIPRALLAAIIASADPDQSLDRLKPEHAGLLIEFALGDALAALEAGLGHRLAILAARAEPDAPPRAAQSMLTLAVTADGLGTSWVELRLAPGHATRLAQLLDRDAGPADAELDLPVTACVRVAAATLSVGEVADLSSGDVILPDQHCRQAHMAVVVIAERLVAPVELTPAGARIAARPVPGCRSPWEWTMENTAEKSQTEALQRADLDDLPVKIVFELGRLDMSLGEIRRLERGALLPLARPLGESVDIVANGRRIGRGTLVQIGDSLGVRIVGLFSHA